MSKMQGELIAERNHIEARKLILKEKQFDF